VFNSITDKNGPLTYDSLETVHALIMPQSSISGESIEFKTDTQGLEGLLEAYEEKERRILPSTSDIMGIKQFRKERGLAGPASLQYGEDLTALKITDVEKFWLLQNFNIYLRVGRTLLNIYLWQITLFKQDSIFFGINFNMLILLYMKPNVPATSPPVLSLLKEEKNQGSIPGYTFPLQNLFFDFFKIYFDPWISLTVTITKKWL
jgi:hypothetical protein